MTLCLPCPALPVAVIGSLSLSSPPPSLGLCPSPFLSSFPFPESQDDGNRGWGSEGWEFPLELQCQPG